jgi:hypothetical protein
MLAALDTFCEYAGTAAMTKNLKLPTKYRNRPRRMMKTANLERKFSDPSTRRPRRC